MDQKTLAEVFLDHHIHKARSLASGSAMAEAIEEYVKNVGPMADVEDLYGQAAEAAARILRYSKEPLDKYFILKFLDNLGSECYDPKLGKGDPDISTSDYMGTIMKSKGADDLTPEERRVLVKVMMEYLDKQDGIPPAGVIAVPEEVIKEVKRRVAEVAGEKSDDKKESEDKPFDARYNGMFGPPSNN